MRIFVTGAGGFVGSNLAHVFAERHGAEVIAPSHDIVDLTDRPLVHRCVAATRPDAIVHAAIWNDPTMLVSDRRRAWKEYVGATRSVVDAANDVDARVVLISTDWVFDGTQGPAIETEPPNPINPYGFLKAASELVITQRAAPGHGRPDRGRAGHPPRAAADAASPGRGLRLPGGVGGRGAARRRQFTVWDGEGLNRVATPTLATDAAELIWLALVGDVSGILHCCGGEHADRVELARRAVAAFGLDAELLDVGPPPDEALAGGAIPRDTRLDATITARRLGAELPDLDTTLARLRHDLETPRMEPGMTQTETITVAQALVRFLAAQHVERDGRRERFFAGCFGIFGHGNVAGLGQALSQHPDLLPYHPARNEQAMVHIAAGYARQRNRLGTWACTTSVGPGATNLVTGAALATINRLPVLLLPGDTFATRSPHPVLQQLEVPHDATVSVNDCLRPVSRFYERVERPEQLIPAALEAMRVLTDPAETGAVTLALPEDVQTEAFAVPAAFLRAADVDGLSPAPRATGRGRRGRADPRRPAAAHHRRGRRHLLRGDRGAAGVRGRHRHPRGRDPGRPRRARLRPPAQPRRRRGHRHRRRQRAGPGRRRRHRDRDALERLHHRLEVGLPGAGRALRQRQRDELRRRQAERGGGGGRRARGTREAA